MAMTTMPTTLGMYSYQWMFLGLQAVWLFFVVAFGACLGSLINVLVYRLPRGIGVVTPPSRCPACETRLTWRENIPVLGWILLRGKCRFCKSPISAEYPIVEAFVGGLIGLFFVLWYLVPAHWVDLTWHGMFPWDALRPEWYSNRPQETWPEFLVVVALLGCLVAMTLVDAKTYTIPLSLAWVATAAGLIGHVGHAVWMEAMVPGGAYSWGGAGGRLRYPSNPAGAYGVSWQWAIPTPRTWPVLGAAIGGAVGLLVSWGLLRAGLIRRSFEDYEEWERSVMGKGKGEVTESRSHEVTELASAGAVVDGSASTTRSRLPDDAEEGGHAGVAVATESVGTAAGIEEEAALGGPEMWTQYPHARREMFKEIVFLAAPISLAIIGGWLAGRFLASSPGRPGVVPGLWLQVLGGVLMGYLVAGGVVWGVRIAGSLAFGKEAMGLGDVHLMAAVGACVGWIDGVLAFFGAAFVGLVWMVMGVVVGGKVKRHLPYGPYLAAATVLVLLLKPEIILGLTALLRVPAGQAPIKIP